MANDDGADAMDNSGKVRAIANLVAAEMASLVYRTSALAHNKAAQQRRSAPLKLFEADAPTEK